MDFVGEHCLDLPRVMRQVSEAPVEARISTLLMHAGCPFHDGDKLRMVAASAVRMVAIGGLSLHALAAHGIGPLNAAAMANEAMGLAGGMSYLSLPGGSPESACEAILSQGHGSIAHAVSVTLIVAGVTCAVENEFNSQRDLVHLARITEARTAAQSSPPVVVPDPTLLPFYRRLVQEVDAHRADAAAALGDACGRRDALEMVNLMHPASKATAFLMTGSLRNLQKLLAAEDDAGKEAEFRRVLKQVREPLAALWPALFRHPGEEPQP